MKCPDWLWFVGQNTLLSPKLMDYWSAHFPFLCNSSCRLWSWRRTRGPIRSWPLARTCSCRGGKVKVKFANVHINPHPVSCCKTCRQALALSLHTAGIRSLNIAAFRPIRYPPQKTVGEATRPLTFHIVTHLLTFRLLLSVYREGKQEETVFKHIWLKLETFSNKRLLAGGIYYLSKVLIRFCHMWFMQI